MKVILVVDDAPENIQLLSGLLKPAYKVKAATNGEKALVIAGKVPAPDLILLDVMMPGMDGYEVCRRLKANDGTCNIPVVFVSGHDSENERQLGLDQGASAFLSKPVEPDTLHTILDELLNG